LQLFGYLLRIGGFLALLYAAALHMETVVDNLYHGKDLPVPGIINTIQYHVQIPIENFVKNIFTAAPGFINEHWIISLIIGAILLPISPILIMAGTSYVLIAALWILIFHFNMVLMYTIELGGKSFEAFGAVQQGIGIAKDRLILNPMKMHLQTLLRTKTKEN